MASPAKLRKRTPAQGTSNLPDLDQTDDHVSAIFTSPNNRSTLEKILDTERASVAVVVTLTLLALALRFYKINHPDQVVFDEVHFGKFASYYILREYYFDVHPPFAKLLFGLAGWFVGFDGHFSFENIGDSYTENHVPYVGMRALPAILGSFTVPVVFAIMKESGYSTVIAAFSALLIVFDNAHVAQSRLILLDATLIFFMSLTIYSYIRFRKLRYWEFTPEWWAWLVATGVFMACTWGSKVNGILTVFTIGIAVLIDLWDILDIKKGYSMEDFWKRFGARAVGLILVPFIIYLSFFYIHFSVLTHSGTGDTFMSPAFQETLIGNELLLNSQELRYYDTVTIKHKDTKVFLHSHVERYPLKYDDGRISTQGQQVTGYGHADTNNEWQLIPTKALPETGRGRIIRHNDVIQLLHVNTQTVLLTHDVASPLMPTNQEFTTFPKDDFSRHNDTLFQVQLVDGGEGEAWKSKSGHFRLVHVPTKVSLWTHPGQLPEWAFKQQEVNGNKNPSEKTATWYVDEIISDECTWQIPNALELLLILLFFVAGDDFKNRTGDSKPKEPKKMNFFKKFGELQLLMLQHNAGLTASHPYASSAINWPFSLTGISFWTENDSQKQIYLVGNIIGWWTCVIALSIYIGIVGADLLARRRGFDPIPDEVRNRLWNSAGFFLLVWAVHYFPFFLMNRQLFIHHYLPSHLASALVAGAVLNFVLSETINYPVSIAGRETKRKPRTYSDLGTKGPIAVGVFAVILFAMFVYMAPLTYGTPGLDGETVNSKRLLSTWTLHFAAKKTAESV
ncbi:glycosyltransferase family 39 protein [Plicaturopsis crispa FD-325 SS-3]|nr:glycosyltransferase family 39 protein [Plicaturopsis crispa FD-325 SS-3]